MAAKTEQKGVKGLTIKPTGPTNLDGSYVYVIPPNMNGGPSIIGSRAEGEDLPGIKINYTGGELGSASGIYYGTMFQLSRLGYAFQKYDETFEINPTYRQYYADTLAQKHELEAKIKAGFSSASQAVSDAELLEHDLRKYAEMMNHFEKIEAGAQGLPKARKQEEKKKFEEMVREGNSSLKSMFVDQVDYNTGDASMLALARTRWPTVIVDFMKLNDNDVTFEKISAKGLGVTTAEAHILATKNGLFVEWKRMFRDAVASRYQRLRELSEARNKSVETYKKWLRPYIVQHEMIKEAYEEPGAAGSDIGGFVRLTGHATSYHKIKLWVWKPFPVAELWKGPVVKKQRLVKTEFLDEKYKPVNFMLNPYDDFVKKKLYDRDDKDSFISEYPWLKEKDIEAQVFNILDDSVKKKLLMDPDVMYYVFFDIEFQRSIIQLPGGAGDDLTVFIRSHFVSQNVMLLRLMQLWAKGQAFEKHVDEMLGVRPAGESGKEAREYVRSAYPKLYGARPGPAGAKNVWASGKKFGKGIEDFLGKFGIRFMLFKGGPYDTDFEERITKQFLSPMGKNYLVEIISLLKTKMEFGK